MGVSGIKIFISHASEDKDAVARPLSRALKRHGYDVWYDEFVLSVGSSLKRSIDKGLAECDFGVVILSEGFFNKNWTQEELGGLVSREMSSGEKIVLPVWHGISADRLRAFSPTLADRIGISTADGIRSVVQKLRREIELRVHFSGVTVVEYGSLFGEKLSVISRPNTGYSTTYFKGNLDEVFSADRLKKFMEVIDKEVKGTTLKKK